LARVKPFSQEYKDEAVRMVLDGPCPVAHVAKELGIHDTPLETGWPLQAQARWTGPEVGSEKSERELQLERENASFAIRSLS